MAGSKARAVVVEVAAQVRSVERNIQAYLDVIYSNAKNELVIAQWFVGTIKVYYAYCHPL